MRTACCPRWAIPSISQRPLGTTPLARQSLPRSTVWTDPEFDPAQKAFYYVRVLEIPTPRWVVYDAPRFGIDLPEGAEIIGQERAYTSPIWYTP